MQVKTNTQFTSHTVLMFLHQRSCNLNKKKKDRFTQLLYLFINIPSPVINSTRRKAAWQWNKLNSDRWVIMEIYSMMMMMLWTISGFFRICIRAVGTGWWGSSCSAGIVSFVSSQSQNKGLLQALENLSFDSASWWWNRYVPILLLGSWRSRRHGGSQKKDLQKNKQS